MAIWAMVKETTIDRRMERVVRYTKFANNPYGDGGSKRSVQIKEYWQDKGVNFIDEKFELPIKYSLMQAMKWCLRAVVFITKNVGWRTYPRCIDKYRAILTYALRLPVIFDKYKGEGVTFLWEYTQDIGPLYLMKAAGAKIIAYPHNLESLVPTQYDNTTHKLAPFWLYEEVERLKMCDEVWAISKEETWLLQLFGINAKYFPYYPPKSAETEFLNIKTARTTQKKESKEFLILGSATNPPTRMGMQELINFFGSKSNLSYTIHIGGYKSETLKYINNTNIVYHGTMSNDDLFDLLVRVDGIIINQPTTSGALTRIVENRIAGIPVYANFGAARDFYNLPDVYVYDTFEELDKMLE